MVAMRARFFRRNTWWKGASVLCYCIYCLGIVHTCGHLSSLISVVHLRVFGFCKWWNERVGVRIRTELNLLFFLECSCCCNDQCSKWTEFMVFISGTKGRNRYKGRQNTRFRCADVQNNVLTIKHANNAIHKIVDVFSCILTIWMIEINSAAKKKYSDDFALEPITLSPCNIYSSSVALYFKSPSRSVRIFAYVRYI